MSTRYVILGQFPVSRSRSSDFTAAQLLTHLDSGDDSVVTLSEPDGNYAQHHLIYRSTRLFAQTLDMVKTEVGPDNAALVFASGMEIGNINKPHLRSRLKEIWRRFRLIRFVGKRAGQVYYVADMPGKSLQFWLMLLAYLSNVVHRPIQVRLVSPKAVRQQFPELDGISPEAAIDGSFNHAFQNLSEDAGTVSPRTIRQYINAKRRDPDADPALLVDMSLLQSLAASNWRSSPHFLRQPRDVDLPHPPKETSRYSTETYTKFATYFREFMRAKQNPALAAVTGLDDFEEWYLNSPDTQRAFPYLVLDPAKIPLPLTHETAAAALLKFAPRVADVRFLSLDHLDWFAAPLGNGDTALSRAEFFFAQCANVKINPRALMEDPGHSQEIRQWYYENLCQLAPALLPFSTLKPPENTSPPCATLAGIVTGESGLAQNADMHANALQHLDIPVDLREHTNLTATSRRIVGNRPLKRDLCIHNINAHYIPRQTYSAALNTGMSPVHVGFLLWELDKLPASHLLAGELLDEVWVPSQFLADILSDAYGRAVHNIGKAISLPPALDHPANPAFTFFTSFDSKSSVERKNPLATVQAFVAAFANTENVRLIVKATPPGPEPWGDPHQQMRKIAKIASKDPRISVRFESLPFDEYITDFQTADCIVSAHRAEGFGYVPAYGMFYEKPVIATNYSGVTDFCTDTTSFPVNYRLKPVEAQEVIAMADGAQWAEIDIAHLAEQMKFVFENPDIARQRASAGKALITEKYAPESFAKTYLTRLRALGVCD